MRQKRTTQTSLFDPDSVDHPVGATLEAISAWLDNHPEWVDAVAADLGAARGKAVGRLGLSCETVLRCAVVRHLHRLSWRGLEFFLRDSRSTRRFVRLGRQRAPWRRFPFRRIRCARHGKNDTTSNGIKRNRGQIVSHGRASSADWNKTSAKKGRLWTRTS